MSSKDSLQNVVPPRLPEEITEELEELRQIETITKGHDRGDAASKFRLRSLQKMKSSLEEELNASHLLGSEEDLEIVMGGDPAQDHMVAAEFFGEFLKDLQDVTNRIFFAAGSPSRVGEKIPESSLMESRMMVTGWHCSSFTVRFRLAPSEQTEDLFVSERRKMALRSLRELFDEKTPEKDLTELLILSASKTAYGKLLRNVAKQGAEIVLRTRVNPYGARLTAEKASERSKWMETPEKKKTEDHLEVIGVLTAGNIDTRWFKIKTKTLPYQGKVAKDAQQQIRNVKLGAAVRALLRQTTTYKTKARPEPTVTFTLESIIEVPKDGDSTQLSL
jgi:hypothetical protein